MYVIFRKDSSREFSSVFGFYFFASTNFRKPWIVDISSTVFTCRDEIAAYTHEDHCKDYYETNHICIHLHLFLAFSYWIYNVFILEAINRLCFINALIALTNQLSVRLICSNCDPGVFFVFAYLFFLFTARYQRKKCD